MVYTGEHIIASKQEKRVKGTMTLKVILCEKRWLFTTNFNASITLNC